jgi:hypothetical protein
LNKSNLKKVEKINVEEKLIKFKVDFDENEVIKPISERIEKFSA